jgi:hypothetical protein
MPSRRLVCGIRALCWITVHVIGKIGPDYNEGAGLRDGRLMVDDDGWIVPATCARQQPTLVKLNYARRSSLAFRRFAD